MPPRRLHPAAVVAFPSPQPPKQQDASALAERLAELTARTRSLVRTYRQRFEGSPGRELCDATSPLRNDLEHLLDTAEDSAVQAERAADHLASQLLRTRVA